MKAYLDLVRHILDVGTRKENRTGVDAISTFNYNYEHDLATGFPLLTTKKISWKNIVIENLWFLSGASNTRILERHGCKIWTPWADQWGSLGPVYGKQWRRWEALSFQPERHFNAPPITLSDAYEKVAGVGTYERGDIDSIPFARLVYNTWAEMLARCYDPKRNHYEWYGGKGVHVDPRWFDFRAFVADVQKLDGWHLKRVFPDEYKLDKDFYNSNRYGQDTCIWASNKENKVNTTKTRLVRATRPDGREFVTLDVSGMCSDYNLDVSTVHKVLRGEVNIHKGWTFRYEPVPEGSRARVRIYDQIQDALALLKTSPMSRRIIVTAWNPSEVGLMKIPPCHYTFAFNVQNTRVAPDCLEPRLCLHMTQRSCDTALGVPYNLAGYAFILKLFSHLSGIKPGLFGHTLIDAHVYTSKPDGDKAEFDHVPGLREQLTREPRPLPRLRISDSIRELSDISALLDKSTEEVMSHFVLDGYDPHPEIKFKVAV